MSQQGLSAVSVLSRHFYHKKCCGTAAWRCWGHARGASCGSQWLEMGTGPGPSEWDNSTNPTCLGAQERNGSSSHLHQTALTDPGQLSEPSDQKKRLQMPIPDCYLQPSNWDMFYMLPSNWDTCFGLVLIEGDSSVLQLLILTGR